MHPLLGAESLRGFRGDPQKKRPSLISIPIVDENRLMKLFCGLDGLNTAFSMRNNASLLWFFVVAWGMAFHPPVLGQVDPDPPILVEKPLDSDRPSEDGVLRPSDCNGIA